VPFGLAFQAFAGLIDEFSAKHGEAGAKGKVRVV
jgi:hypothetical protein